jgi:hypothetical protein
MTSQLHVWYYSMLLFNSTLAHMDVSIGTPINTVLFQSLTINIPSIIKKWRGSTPHQVVHLMPTSIDYRFHWLDGFDLSFPSRKWGNPPYRHSRIWWTPTDHKKTLNISKQNYLPAILETISVYSNKSMLKTPDFFGKNNQIVEKLMFFKCIKIHQKPLLHVTKIIKDRISICDHCGQRCYVTFHF